MKTRFILSVILALSGIMTYAQGLKIQGRVTHEGSPLPNANVVEIDANHRIINQTLADASGYFTLNVTGGKTSIRVTHHGMRKYTHKIGTRTMWEISLDKEKDMDPGKVRSRHETTKLLVGHLQGRTIPQLTWVEHLTDSTFCIIVPVRTVNGVEEYPQGRKMVVQDYNGHIIATGLCIEPAMPEEGLPQSYDPYVRTSSNNSANNNSQFTTDDRDYFCYPRFLFKRTDLENVIDHSTEVACFAVDTTRGDNYWIYYKAKNLGKELQKILNKMLK